MTELVHRREIDGLRAIAVLAVVSYHAVAMPKAGYVGVDVFFVISGYLITALLLREHAETGRIDLIGFYARRVRRIFPAAVVVILSVLACAVFLLAPQDLVRLAHSASASSVFGANLFFEATTGGYFDPDAGQMPLLHLWSLAVEEQFYLFWPVMLIMLSKLWPNRLVPIIAAIGCGSFALSEILMRISPEAAFYQMPARFWELAAGGLVAALPVRTRTPRWVSPIAFAVVVIACAWPCARFPGVGALPVVAGTAALLWTMQPGGGSGFAVACLRSRPMVGIGLVSYSLYLWHWPLLAFYRASTIGAGSAQVRVGLCGIALLLAIVSYRCVETPFRRMRASRRLLAVGTLCSITLAACAWFYACRLQADEAARPRDNPLAMKAENDWPPNWRKCHYQVWSTDFPRAGCETIPGRKPGIVVWGDSMALTWRPLAEAMGRHAGQSAIDYSRDACPPFLGYLPPHPLPGDFKCRDWNAKVVERAKGADVVVLVARWNADIAGDGEHGVVEGFRATLRMLTHDVRRVIVIGATPELRDQVPRCIRKHAIAECSIPRREFDRIDASVMADIHHAAAGLPNVEFVDMAGFFCKATECPAVRNGVPLYVDSHHISHAAAKIYADAFVRGK